MLNGHLTMDSTELQTLIPWCNEAELPGEAELFVELNVRSLAPPTGTHEGQTDVIETLSDLESAGVIEELRLCVFGERICPCDTCGDTRPGRAALDRVREYQRWAANLDTEVSIPFERRTIHSEIAETDYEVIVPPRVSLGIYDDATLLGVFPCEIGDTVYTVGDVIEALEPSHAVENPVLADS